MTPPKYISLGISQLIIFIPIIITIFCIALAVIIALRGLYFLNSNVDPIYAFKRKERTVSDVLEDEGEHLRTEGKGGWVGNINNMNKYDF